MFIRSPIVVACIKKNRPIIDELLKRDDIILNKYSSFKKDIDPEIFKVVDKRREELKQEPMPEDPHSNAADPYSNDFQFKLD